MNYQAIYLIEHGFNKEPFRFAGADADGRIRREAYDGVRTKQYSADALYLFRAFAQDEKKRKILHYMDQPIQMTVTSSRLTFCMQEYFRGTYKDDTMREHVKRATESVPAYRRGEKILGGMLRYEWIAGITYVKRKTSAEPDQLHLVYKDENRMKWFVELFFYRESDCKAMACEILSRLCLYRMLMQDEKNDKEIVFFNSYRKKGFGDPDQGEIRIPTSYPAPGGERYRPDPDCLLAEEGRISNPDAVS